MRRLFSRIKNVQVEKGYIVPAESVISLTTKKGFTCLFGRLDSVIKRGCKCIAGRREVEFPAIARPIHANRVENCSFSFNRAKLAHGASNSPVRPTGPAQTKPRRDRRFRAFITRDDVSKSPGDTNSRAEANRSASTPSSAKATTRRRWIHLRIQGQHRIFRYRSRDAIVRPCHTDRNERWHFP